MKKMIIIIGFVLLSGFAWHKYYVSVTEVNIQKDKLEIIIRTFPDDIQNVLQDTYHIKADLDKEKTYKYLKMYILEHFQLAVNNQETNYEFSGFTQEDGFFILLLETKIPDELTDIQIRNSILMDMFDEQKNIIHFLTTYEKQSFILTKENKIAKYHVKK